MIKLNAHVPEFNRIVKAAYHLSRMETDVNTIFDCNKILVTTIERLVEEVNESMKYKPITSKVQFSYLIRFMKSLLSGLLSFIITF